MWGWGGVPGWVTGSGADTAACCGASQLQMCQKRSISVFFAVGVCWKLGVQDREKSDKTGEWSEWRDSSEFSGKLTSSQHQCEDIILPARSHFLQVPWAHRTYGNLFPTSRLGTGSRWTPWGKNSAQVWKRLKHITKLTGFKDILLTSKLHHPPPTCLPHSPTLLSPSHFLCLLTQDQ